MACLTAQSHYLNQCWLNISEVWWQLFEGEKAIPQPWIAEISFNNNCLFESPRGQCIKGITLTCWCIVSKQSIKFDVSVAQQTMCFPGYMRWRTKTTNKFMINREPFPMLSKTLYIFLTDLGRKEFDHPHLSEYNNGHQSALIWTLCIFH